jgi:hypothetical protein
MGGKGRAMDKVGGQIMHAGSKAEHYNRCRPEKTLRLNENKGLCTVKTKT